MQKHYKNVKQLNDFCAKGLELGDIITDNGTITYMGKSKESNFEKIELSGCMIIPSFKNYDCDVRGLSSNEIENLILENINAGVTDLIVITNDFLLTKLILEKYHLNYKIALRVEYAKEISEINKEKTLIYLEPAMDEENELEEASDFAGKNKLKVFIKMFDNLELIGELNSKTKKLPINYIEDFGLLDRGGYISGAICSDKEDYNILNQYDFEIVVRPMCDLRKGNGFANIIQIQNAGIPLSIGTGADMHIDIFQVLRTLYLGTRGLLCDEDAVSENDVFSIAQRNIIKENEIASFIIIKDRFKNIEELLNCANKQDIVLTISNGKIIKSEDKKNDN